MADVCVIIPMYNFGAYTSKCVDIVLENAGMDVDIIVVDDGSKLKYENDIVQVIRLDENSGFTNAVNSGIKDCWNKYKYVLLLNNDTQPKPDFVKYLYDVMEKDTEIGIAGSCRQTTLDGRDVLHTTPADLCFGLMYYSVDAPEEEVMICPWIPFCSVMLRMEMLEQIGILDKRMRNHCSDNDLCFRAGEMGYKTALVTKSIVKHHQQLTTTSVHAVISDDRVYLNNRIGCKFMANMLGKFPIDGKAELNGKVEFTLIGGDSEESINS